MDATRYSRLARAHLREHRPQEYAELQANGVLDKHFEELESRAEAMEESLCQQLLAKNPAPEDHLKRAQHLQWAQRTAEEMTLNEMMLLPDPETEAARQTGYVGEQREA